VVSLLLLGLFVLGWSSQSLRSQAVMPLPIEGLPASFHYCVGITKTDTEWIAASLDSVFLGLGTSNPQVDRVPGGGEILTIATHPRGLVVAGSGFAYLRQGGIWKKLDVDDRFLRSRAVPDGTLLVGLSAVYFVDQGGSVTKILPLTILQLANIITIRGELYIFCAKDGIYRWDGTKLHDASEVFPWAKGALIANIREQSGGGLLALTSRGFYSVSNGEAKVISPRAYAWAMQNLIIDAMQWGDILVVGSFYGGISAYSVQTDEQLWNIGPEALGGNVHTMLCFDDHLLVGSSTSLSMVFNPSTFTCVQIPKGDNQSTKTINGRPTLTYTSGAYYLDTLEKITDERIYSLAGLPSGAILKGGFGRVTFGTDTVRIKGRNVVEMAVIDEDRCFALQPHGLSIVSRTGTINRVELGATVDSIVRCGENRYFVGTSKGFVTISADGQPIARFGDLLSHVYACANRAIGIDSSGTMYDSEGHRILQIPNQESLDAVEWENSLYVLFRDRKGPPWIAVFDFKQNSCTALDAPVPETSAKLTALHDGLGVVGYGFLLTIKEPRPASPIVLSKPKIRSGMDRWKDQLLELPSHASALEFELPVSKLRPWNGPRYDIHLDGEEVSTNIMGGVVQIPRIPRGRSTLSITAYQAGEKQQLSLQVHRTRPWYARWFAVVAYCGTAAALSYAAMRARTRQLEKRAAQLQSKVEEKTAELRRAQKAREEFFSTLSHEIRNPLNGVVGLCEILNRGDNSKDPEKQKTLLRTLQGCSDQLRSIIDDVLDFTRIDRGEITIRSEPFELNAAVESAVRAIDPELARSTIELLPSPTWLQGDAGKVRQIVTNLVSNALKYGVPPKAHVHILAQEASTEEVAVRIAVVNTGPCIPADEIEAIFSGFIRGTNAAKRRIEGSGLGLAVSRGIARAMGGALNATSANGTTEFQLNLTLPRSSALQGKSLPERRFRQCQILAVEDEPYNRLVLQHMLEDIGIEADWAPDGASALKRLRTQVYDVVITDLALPEVTGFELARIIQTEITPPPAVIAITAFSTPEKIEQARTCGIRAVLTKPISEEKLAEALGRELAGEHTHPTHSETARGGR
jgi:signal transduction histidine kinase/CheY-like chemotaxis protein